MGRVESAAGPDRHDRRGHGRSRRLRADGAARARVSRRLGGRAGRSAGLGGAPYGIAVDRRRGLVYVTLTATNRLESFRVSGTRLVPDQTWPTVRQPNSVAVDEATGRVFITGRADGQLELIDLGTHGMPVPH